MRRRPGVIDIMSPWPRTGSSNLFEAQSDFFSRTGRDVAILVGPCDYSHNDYNGELLADIEEAFAWPSVTHRSWASFGRDLRRAELLGKAQWVLAGRDSDLKILARMALQTSFTPAFKAFIASHDIDIIYVNHVFQIILGERAASLVQRCSGVRPKLVLESHDIQSTLNARAFRLNRFSWQRDPYPRLLADELSLMSKADIVTHVSNDDLEFFAKHLPDKQHALVLPTLSPTTERKLVARRTITGERPIDFVWVGNNNPGNVKSVKWFLQYVMPHIKREGLLIYFVGTIREYFKFNEADIFKQFEHIFVGEVPDVVPYYDAAKVVIVPVTFGTGASIKFVEAMCMGKPVVATSLAYRGMLSDMIEHMPISGHDTPVGFAQAMMDALINTEDLGARCAAFYDRFFSTEHFGKALASVAGIDYLAMTGHGMTSAAANSNPGPLAGTRRSSRA
jgi:glycosyltransferase involved in cell wall biosynthesis